MIHDGGIYTPGDYSSDCVPFAADLFKQKFHVLRHGRSYKPALWHCVGRVKETDLVVFGWAGSTAIDIDEILSLAERKQPERMGAAGWEYVCPFDEILKRSGIVEGRPGSPDEIKRLRAANAMLKADRDKYQKAWNDISEHYEAVLDQLGGVS